jgi:hypothetical protein
MNYLHIEFGTGQMEIHMEEFFPCGIQKFKKLMKIIDLDCQHKVELKEELRIYLQNKISELVQLRKENSRKYFDNKQKAADTERMIESRKHTNGLPLSEDEMKQAKADLKEYTSAYKKALSNANKNLRFKEQLEKIHKLL